jgi:ethanolamine phosphate transferase 2 subunit G
VLIDALRCDFVYENESKGKSLALAQMLFLNKLIKDGYAAPFKLVARPPSVTMPRIKSLVSGIVPEFIDFLWNFNSSRLNEDNFLKQFKLNNKSIVFYGDDTWLKLFEPASEYFVRFEGTTSFVASDYYEVRHSMQRR